LEFSYICILNDVSYFDVLGPGSNNTLFRVVTFSLKEKPGSKE